MESHIAKSVFNELGVTYVITDLNLKIVEIGGNFTAFEFPPSVETDQALIDLFPEYIGLEDVLGEILAGDLNRFELSWINREDSLGNTIYLNLTSLPYQNKDNSIVGLFQMIEDITDVGSLNQKIMQQRNNLHLLRRQLANQNLELNIINEELQQLSELKSQFISIAAHEFKTPLSVINGYLEILLDEERQLPTAKAHKFLEIIKQSSSRLQLIINDLLDVTQIEAGYIELILKPVDLSALLNKLSTEFMPIIKAKTQTLTLQPISSAPPLLLCDELRTTQILSNLISNANKYTPAEGCISIEVTHATEPGFLQISIIDNGYGISAEDQTKLFSRFFRANSNKQRATKGTGLGLFITQALVEQHGGKIWVESELGQGSKFHVTLPTVDVT